MMMRATNDSKDLAMCTWKQFATLMSAACMFTACNDTPISPPDVTFPSTNVSFNSHVKPVLLYSCATGGCHDGYSSDPENPGSTIFRLETYSDVLGSGIISTFEPERSRLAMVLRGELLHPNDRSFQAVSTSQREGIIQWIREGALNN